MLGEGANYISGNGIIDARTVRYPYSKQYIVQSPNVIADH
jgi:hypothetical protein